MRHGPLTKEQIHAHLEWQSRTFDDEESDTMRNLPLDVVESPEFLASSLALRMVHQLVRPSLRMGRREFKPDALCVTVAAVLQRAVTSQGVYLRETEAEALIREGIATGLWDEDPEGILVIFAEPYSKTTR